VNLIKASAVAAQLGISARKVYELAGDPLPCYRIGGSVRFDQADVDAYVESCRAMPRPKGSAIRLRSVDLLVSAPDGESALTKQFRALGITPRTATPSGSKRPKPQPKGGSVSVRPSR